MHYKLQAYLQYILQAYRIEYMGLLEFNKKEKRDTAITVRVPESVVEKLKQISKSYEVSQADVLIRLIESAFVEMQKGSSNKKKRG